MPQELLQQVRVLDPTTATDQVADVLLEGGQICAIAPQLEAPAHATRRDARGWVLGPGLVDLYSTSGEPGFEERETLASLSQAALAGGFTRVTLLPNTHPVLDTPATLAQLENLIQHLDPHPPLRIQFWGALTQATQGQQMSELLELAAAGVAGFADGLPLGKLALVRRLLEYLQPLNLPIALWPCDRALSGSGIAREGSISLQLGLPGSPAMAETTALAALLECLRDLGPGYPPVHCMRLSTARSVALIQQAKSEAIAITASTPWHHLLLNSADLAGYDPNLRLDPPLGNPADQAALLEAVRTGVIDAIAIDHSPWTYEEKTVAFGEAPSGAIGLELALPLLWQRLVISGQWSALDLWRALSSAPAHCLQQQPPSLAIEQGTEAILFDPQSRWSVVPGALRSLACNTPWLGKEICGRVLRVYGS